MRSALIDKKEKKTGKYLNNEEKPPLNFMIKNKMRLSIRIEVCECHNFIFKEITIPVERQEKNNFRYSKTKTYLSQTIEKITLCFMPNNRKMKQNKNA
jgi:hypothetical protein